MLTDFLVRGFKKNNAHAQQPTDIDDLKAKMVTAFQQNMLEMLIFLFHI
jgi:hypothetical protein